MIGLSTVQAADGVHVLWTRDPNVVDYKIQVFLDGVMIRQTKFDNSLRKTHPNQTYDYGGLSKRGHYRVVVSSGSYPTLSPLVPPYVDFNQPAIESETVEFTV